MQPCQFAIAYRSSEDRKFPASGLSTSAATRGWQSDPRAELPQILVVDLLGRPVVRQMQLIAHEIKTPARVIFYVTSDSTLESARFRNLGFTTFCRSDGVNRRGALRCVRIDEEVTFIKLVFDSVFPHPLNVGGQIGISSLVLLGEPSIGGPHRQPHPPGVSGSGLASQVEQDLRTDASVMEIVSSLQRGKKRCVEAGDFEKANEIKLRIAELASLALHVQELESQLRQAVAEEDFQLAQALRSEINDRRNACYSIGLSAPVSIRIPNSGRTQAQDAEQTKHSQSGEATPQRLAFDEQPVASHRVDTVDPMGVQAGNSTARARLEPLTDDDQQMARRIRRALKEDVGDPENADDTLKAVVADNMLQCFGRYLTCCLFSKRHVLREAGCKVLAEGNIPGGSDEMVGAIVSFLLVQSFGLSDRVNSVFFAASHLLELGLTDRLEGSAQGVLAQRRTEVVSTLSGRLADSNERVRTVAMDMLAQLAALPAVGTATVIDATINGRFPNGWQAWKARMSLVSRVLVPSAAENPNALDEVGGFASLMRGLVVPALHHAKPNVRDAAVELVAEFERVVGRETILSETAQLKPTVKKLIEKRLAASGSTKVRPVGVSSGSPQEEAPRHYASPVSTGRGTAGDSNDGSSVADQRQPHEPSLEHDSPEVWPRRVQPSPREGECQFCGLADNSFEDHAELLQHFQAECPMLLNCPLCQLPVEIRDINDHLVEDCAHRARVARCPRCRCGFRKDTIASHVADGKCAPADRSSIVCSLCQTRLPDIDAFWAAHILEPPYCPGNTRSVVD
uniref:TOG domain-containing protein n=1 Tax=Neobodo designis TaxID=312471 RepID=A0A7S1M9M6_NEODS